MTNPLRRNAGRVDGHLLLTAMDYIAAHGGATVAEVAEVLEVSPHTAQRLFRNAREQFGVKITYQKTNQPYIGAGEFSVEDWGVFDRGQVRRFLNKQRPQLNKARKTVR